MYKFNVFKFKITLRLSETFLGTSKIGETNWLSEGLIFAMAVFSFRMWTYLEIDKDRKVEKEPEERFSIGGSEKNWIFKPNSTMFNIKELEVKFLQTEMKIGRRPAPGEGSLGAWRTGASVLGSGTLLLLIRIPLVSLVSLVSLVTLVFFVSGVPWVIPLASVETSEICSKSSFVLVVLTKNPR